MAYVRKKFIEIMEKGMKEGEQMTPEEMLITHEGIVYSTVFCNPEQFKALEAFQTRSDDVVLAGYCKSGGVSDCKTLFSEANNKEMDTVFQERLEGTKVGKLIKYDRYCKT